MTRKTLGRILFASTAIAACLFVLAQSMRAADTWSPNCVPQVYFSSDGSTCQNVTVKNEEGPSSRQDHTVKYANGTTSTVSLVGQQSHTFSSKITELKGHEKGKGDEEVGTWSWTVSPGGPNPIGQ